jgi:hypothetical protein
MTEGMVEVEVKEIVVVREVEVTVLKEE